MRLIDAEQFIVEMENNIGNIYNPDIIKGMRFAIDLIKSIPTAYDVEGVVEQMRNYPYSEKIGWLAFSEILNIVGAGGVNE